MPITYNIETDYLYQQGIATGEQKGIEKGLEKGQILEKQKTIERLLVLYNWSIQQVADFAEVSESFVINIKNQLIKDGKLKG